jgi:hypothetical protein
LPNPANSSTPLNRTSAALVAAGAVDAVLKIRRLEPGYAPDKLLDILTKLYEQCGRPGSADWVDGAPEPPATGRECAVSRRKFGPRSADHPTVADRCPACQVPFAAGDYTTLVALGPGGWPEEQRKAASGLAYNAVAVEVHWACATGEPAEPTAEPQVVGS